MVCPKMCRKIKRQEAVHHSWGVPWGNQPPSLRSILWAVCPGYMGTIRSIGDQNKWDTSVEHATKVDQVSGVPWGRNPSNVRSIGWIFSAKAGDWSTNQRPSSDENSVKRAQKLIRLGNDGRTDGCHSFSWWGTIMSYLKQSLRYQSYGIYFCSRF